MYNPPHFRDDEAKTLMMAGGLCNFITATADGLVANPIPMYLAPDEGERGVLYGHVARANPQWQSPPTAEALAIFMGPDAYISPSWYPNKATDGKVVPTWNYIAVHAYGPVEFFDDSDRLLAVITRLTQLHEGSRAEPWAVSDAPPDYIALLLRRIVGVRLTITRIDAKKKMSQNRGLEDRDSVVKGLQDSGRESDRVVGKLVADTVVAKPL